jgi:hypothetical protein
MMVGKVIMMVEILKERVGWLHQVNKFTTHTTYPKDFDGRKIPPRRMMEVGMIIALSQKPIDTDAVGYQKPKATPNLCKTKYKINIFS